MSLSDNNNLENVASSIQERANELSNEIHILNRTKIDLETIQEKLYCIEKQNLSKRKKLLKTVRLHHGYELELYDMKDKIDENETKSKQIETDITNQKQLLNDKQSTYDEMAQIYANHELYTNLYQRIIQDRINDKKQKQQNKTEFLEKLKHATHIYNSKTQRMKNTKQQLINNINQLTTQEVQDDDKSIELSNSIRTMLSKRTSLRRKLQDAKESYRAAKEEEEVSSSYDDGEEEEMM